MAHVGPAQGAAQGTSQTLTMPSRYRFWSSVSLSMSKASWSGHRGGWVKPGQTPW